MNHNAILLASDFFNSLLEEDRKRCMEAGMDDYFAKPFTPAALIEKVGRWIDR
jgi:CheY-like chemotaxis protein